VVAALAAWFGLGKTADTDCRIAVRVNGQAVTNIAARGGQKTLAVAVPSALLKDGRNLVDFKMEGRANTPMPRRCGGSHPN